jgi:hypothetical protein
VIIFYGWTTPGPVSGLLGCSFLQIHWRLRSVLGTTRVPHWVRYYFRVPTREHRAANPLPKGARPRVSWARGGSAEQRKSVWDLQRAEGRQILPSCLLEGFWVLDTPSQGLY